MKNLIITLAAIFILFSCKKEEDPTPIDDNPTNTVKIDSLTIDKTTVFQEMTGFGGALSWYCERVVNSPKEDEITDLLFNDLGADIIRLKNWYYPTGYPANKSPDNLTPNWFKPAFDATNQLYDIAKAKNPDIEVLFSSWSPPTALKSNGELNTGQLKQNADGSFMYEEFAQYWVDILDHISFTPDYLSIQNEPNYVNTGWETCEWRASEVSIYGGYDQALDAVYEKIKDRPNAPMLIGPESANLSSSSFDVFVNAIKDRSYLGMYGWHPYNFGKGTDPSTTVSTLKKIQNSFNDRPNMMTEYSDNMDWFNTGRFINNTLVYANTSTYIYWKMMWANASDDHAMISVTSSGDYTVTPYFYILKHFAKHIDKGYKRVAATASKTNFETSAFISPDGKKLTVILFNTASSKAELEVKMPSLSPTGLTAWQTISGNPDMYMELKSLPTSGAITFPAKSVTTLVYDL